jgi:hypothetical protein
MFLMYNAHLNEQILMAAFVRIFAQKVTAELCPLLPLVMRLHIRLVEC